MHMETTRVPRECADRSASSTSSLGVVWGLYPGMTMVLARRREEGSPAPAIWNPVDDGTWRPSDVTTSKEYSCSSGWPKT